MNNAPEPIEEWAVRMAIATLEKAGILTEGLSAINLEWYRSDQMIGPLRLQIESVARSFMQLRGEVKQECEAIAMEEAEASTWTKDATPNAVGSLIAYRIRTQHKPRSLHNKQQQ